MTFVSNGTHAIQVMPCRFEYLYWTCPELEIGTDWGFETKEAILEHIIEKYTHAQDWFGQNTHRGLDYSLVYVKVDEDGNEKEIARDDGYKV